MKFCVLFLLLVSSQPIDDFHKLSLATPICSHESSTLLAKRLFQVLAPRPLSATNFTAIRGLNERLVQPLGAIAEFLRTLSILLLLGNAYTLLLLLL